jgi:hypothetical protein
MAGARRTCPGSGTEKYKVFVTFSFHMHAAIKTGVCYVNP